MNFTLATTSILLLLVPTVQPVDAATERLFAANVGHLVDARLDPLVKPGSCASHVHSVFGNALFGADITPQMLLDPTGDWTDIKGEYNTTTSELIPNLSMYWAPSMYIVKNGVHHLVPSFARTYYRITLRSDGDTSRIHAFPPFLRMIVGDASRKIAWASEDVDRDNIRWTLRTINRNSTNYMQHGDWSYLVNNKDLANIDEVEMKLRFPECLAVNSCTGVPITESKDWRSHAAYISGWDHDRQSFCPKTHPYQIPMLDLEVRYKLDPMRELLGVDHVNDVSNWILSSGDKSGAGGHADFVNGWPTELMQNMIQNCTDAISREGRECYLEQFEINGRANKAVPYYGKVPHEQVDKLTNLLTAADECLVTSPTI